MAQSTSEKPIPPLRGLHTALLLAVSMLIAAPVPAAQDAIEIHEALLQKFIDAVTPRTLIGTYEHFSGGLLEYDCAYKVVIPKLKIVVDPSGIMVTGEDEAPLSADWCPFSFKASLKATGHASYHAGLDALCFSFDSATIQPQFSVGLGTVKLPVRINIASTLNVPCIPLGVARITYRTPGGLAMLRVVPENVVVDEHNGYVSIESDVSLP